MSKSENTDVVGKPIKPDNCLCGGYGVRGVHVRFDIVCPVCDMGDEPTWSSEDTQKPTQSPKGPTTPQFNSNQGLENE